MTVSLAVLRPRLGLRSLRVSPGFAAVLGVLILLAARLLDFATLLDAARVQWRPLVSLTCIMIMTGVVLEVGAFDRLAEWLEARARGRSAKRTFTLVFALSVVTSALLNNDAAILTLTPLVVALTRRLYPGRTELTIAFAFAVFLAPGVAPFIVSNPMNMIVAEFGGLEFNSYAAVMLPISIAGALVTYLILRLVYRRELASISAPRAIEAPLPRRAGERSTVLLMISVFCAYPIAAMLGAQIVWVALAGAVAAIILSRVHNIATPKKLAAHVSLDVLAFLWGIFLVVKSLQTVGVAGALSGVYHDAAIALPSGGGRQLATIGVLSTIGSAIIDNHPMALLNMMALDAAHGARPLLAALVGGDLGPRLLPIGSLAGLLWMELLRRSGVEIGVVRFVRVGTLALLPTLTISLLLLWLL